MNTVPIITSNGTGRDVLKAERMAAIRALHEAAEVVARITVNGRDYIGEPERLGAAIAARDGILRTLREEQSRLTQEIIDLRRA